MNQPWYPLKKVLDRGIRGLRDPTRMLRGPEPAKAGPTDPICKLQWHGEEAVPVKSRKSGAVEKGLPRRSCDQGTRLPFHREKAPSGEEGQKHSDLPLFLPSDFLPEESIGQGPVEASQEG